MTEERKKILNGNKIPSHLQGIDDIMDLINEAE